MKPSTTPNFLLHQTFYYTKPSNPSENDKHFKHSRPHGTRPDKSAQKGSRACAKFMLTLKWWDEAATLLLGKVIEVKYSKKKNAATKGVNSSRNV